jgi:hypothetical protein
MHTSETRFACARSPDPIRVQSVFNPWPKNDFSRLLLRDSLAPQASVTPVPFGAMVSVASSELRATPSALDTPLGGA